MTGDLVELTAAQRALAEELANGLDALLALVERLQAIEAAARDPFLVLLERHPNADPVANAEMQRAADRLREVLRAR